MSHKKDARQARKEQKQAIKRGDKNAAHIHGLGAAYHGVSKRDLRRQVKQANGKRSWL